MPALYELAHQYREAADKLADLDLDAQTVKDTLDSMSGELEVKASATAAVIRNMEALAGQIKEAETVMAQRRKAIESRAASLSAYLLANMAHAGIQSVETPHFAIKIKANPGHVEVYDEKMIPAEFMRQRPPPAPEPDKTALKAALLKGLDVQGARFVRGSRLEIK
jgi:threonyl-tRNA synthetase